MVAYCDTLFLCCLCLVSEMLLIIFHFSYPPIVAKHSIAQAFALCFVIKL